MFAALISRGFETSLQVLRGFETDITAEVNDIKASTLYFSSGLTKCELWTISSLAVNIFFRLDTRIIFSFDAHIAEGSVISEQKDYNQFSRVKPKEIPHAPNCNFLNFVGLIRAKTIKHSL